MSKLVLMGSGETAPSLVGVHRGLLERLRSPRCCWLDTPYGFQENADILSQKTAEFFQQSLGQRLHVAQFRRSDQPDVATQLAYTLVRESNYIFSGPGSPSYAQRHWSQSEFPSIFLEKLRSPEEAVLVFASAGVCSLGALCLPAYEIYKVGQDPHWLPGLDILPALGFDAVVIPHYNNTVGGNHDTRFCYLGERRLSELEKQLEAHLWIWGVDEHTAVTLDLDAGTFEVQGKSGFTLRKDGHSRVFPAGHRGALNELRNPDQGNGVVPSGREVLQATPVASTQGLITELVRPLGDRFHEALQSANGLTAAQALLDMEQVLHDWSGDSDVHHWGIARALFRNLLAQLGRSAERGLQDPTEPIAPFVRSLLDIREQSRAEKHFQRADWIRQQLVAAGVEIQDTPQGTRWTLKPESYVL